MDLEELKQSAVRERAFEHETMRHAASLMRAATRMTHDSAIAEELVQDTLLRAWRFFDRFEPGTNCRAWLFRIMINLSMRLRQKRSVELTSVPLHESHVVDRAFSDRDFLEQTLIQRAFDALPPDQRTVLHLAVVDGFTCKEIAAMLSLPIGTVMSRVSRARAALRNAVCAILHRERAWPRTHRSSRQCSDAQHETVIRCSTTELERGKESSEPHANSSSLSI